MAKRQGGAAPSYFRSLVACRFDSCQALGQAQKSQSTPSTLGVLGLMIEPELGGRAGHALVLRTGVTVGVATASALL